MIELKIGVVGYCPPTVFDEKLARQMIEDAYSRIEAHFTDVNIAIVSGLTNVGVFKIAYEEAQKKGWRTVGVACKRAEEHELFPVDEKIIVGENWGDESPRFLEGLNAIIRIGTGKQSVRETNVIKALGKPALEYDLPALAA
jgi:hypothetical protein